jgi:peptide deformylase
MNKPILWEGTETLRATSEPWDLNSPELLAHCKDLVDTLRAPPSGLGLASPQIGMSRRSFIVTIPFNSRGYGLSNDPTQPHFAIYVNPVLVADPLSSKVLCDEGCLSLPGVVASVSRPRVIKVTATRIPVNMSKDWGLGVPEQVTDLRLEGMPARVFQHEFDHLNGTLFIDRLDPGRAANAKIDWKNCRNRLLRKQAKSPKFF